MAQDTVAEIKRKLTIQDVVGPYVKLTRAGKALKGLCPFHKEKTPSFTVSLERGSYHCFGCGEGGDMFSFVEKMEGLDFKGALKLLADKAGVEIVYDPAAREHASRAERLREAMARAVEFYTSRLPRAATRTSTRRSAASPPRRLRTGSWATRPTTGASSSRTWRRRASKTKSCSQLV
jgi:DNA primase